MDTNCPEPSEAPLPVGQWRVEPEEAGMRLDKFLAVRNPECSRVYFQKCIEDGRAAVNGQALVASARLAAGDSVELEWPPREAERLEPQEIPLDVLHEDDDLLILNKPAGLVVHPAPGNRSGTLVSALLFREPETFAAFSDEEYRPGIVHRLDKDTSGVMVVTRNLDAWQKLKEAFAAHEVSKIYLAVVRGHFSQRSGTIDAPIGRSARDRRKMAVAPSGRPALTKYRLLGEACGCSLLMVRIYTGRTHQIRVHLSHIGHPVLGDALYGGRNAAPQAPFAAPRQLLHAWKIALKHPATGEDLQFTAPVPPDFQTALAQFPEAAHSIL